MKAIGKFELVVIVCVVAVAIFFGYGKISNQIDTKQFDIVYLSSEKVVIPYLKENKKLPDYYITKKQARDKGWGKEGKDLCKLAPGKIIGGDYFSNRERNLPYSKDRKWFEADLNYKCGNRGADRIVYSDDGLIFVTYNHYKTFKER